MFADGFKHFGCATLPSLAALRPCHRAASTHRPSEAAGHPCSASPATPAQTLDPKHKMRSMKSTSKEQDCIRKLFSIHMDENRNSAYNQINKEKKKTLREAG